MSRRVRVILRMADGSELHLLADLSPRQSTVIRSLELADGESGATLFRVPFTLTENGFVARDPDNPSPLDWQDALDPPTYGGPN